MNTIYLVRHGEITQRMPRRFVGLTDLPLTERGREHMAEVGRYLAGCGVRRVVCSPLSRCVDSAGIICGSCALESEIISDLREISLGAWEGLTADEVRERYPGGYEARGRNLAGFRPPEGESFVDLLRRCWPVFEEVAATNGPVVIVAHGGVNRALLCRMLEMPLANLFRLGQDYACINVLQFRDGTYQVEKLNFCPHHP